jgi:hypothetical protein
MGDIFESNLVNLVILVSGVVYLLGDILITSLTTRTQEIVETFQIAGKKSLVMKKLQIRQEKLLYKLAVIETLREVIIEEGIGTIRTKTASQYSKMLRTLLTTIDDVIGASTIRSTSRVVSNLWSKSVLAYASYLIYPLLP